MLGKFTVRLISYELIFFYYKILVRLLYHNKYYLAIVNSKGSEKRYFSISVNSWWLVHNVISTRNEKKN